LALTSPTIGGGLQATEFYVGDIKANGLIPKSITKIQGERAIFNVMYHYVSNSNYTSREYDQNCMKRDITGNLNGHT
jgi:hypothetical protein